MLDYIRIGCAVPPVQVAETARNAEDICSKIVEADKSGCDIVVFPELAITGYTCGDLFFQDALLDAAVVGIKKVCECTKQYPAVTVAVGMPLMIGMASFPKPFCLTTRSFTNGAGSLLLRICNRKQFAPAIWDWKSVTRFLWAGIWCSGWDRMCFLA